MNRDEFLNTLRNKLGNIRPDVLDEIMSDFEEHFLIASESGATDEEICKILGSPDDIAKQYLEELSGDMTNKSNGQNEHGSSENSTRNEQEFSETTQHGNESHNFDYKHEYQYYGEFDDLVDTLRKSADILRENAEKIGVDIAEKVKININDKLFNNLNMKFKKIFGQSMGDYARTEPEHGGEYWHADSFITLDPDEIKSLTIDLKNSDITVERSSDEKITIDFRVDDDERVACRITNSGGHVYVRDAYDMLGRGRNVSACDDCHISIPESYVGTLSAQSISGDILVMNIDNLGRFNISTVSGDLGIRNSSGPIFPKTVSGDIKIYGFNAEIPGPDGEKGFYLHTASGDINISGFECSQKAHIGTGSGDIDISGFKCGQGAHISSGSGDVSINDARSELRIRSGSGSIEIEDGAGDVYASTGSGDIKIKNIDGNAGANTGSGNIEISNTLINKETGFVTASGDIKLNVREITAPVKIRSTAGNIYIKAPALNSDVMASTGTGDIRFRTGSNCNICFNTDSDNAVIDRRKSKEANRQYPEVVASLKARRGNIVIEDI